MSWEWPKTRHFKMYSWSFFWYWWYSFLWYYWHKWCRNFRFASVVFAFLILLWQYWHMRHFVLVLFILLMLCLSLTSQNFIAKKHNTNTGLLSINNTKTIQDSNFFYYTCSFGGLQRYDGTQFKSFKNLDGLHNYRVTDICEIGRNQFLLCNYFTLFKFDGHSFMVLQTGLPPTVIYKKVIALSGSRNVVVTNGGPYLWLKYDKLPPFILNSY